jgi:hypothetical protein
MCASVYLGLEFFFSESLISFACATACLAIDALSLTDSHSLRDFSIRFLLSSKSRMADIAGPPSGLKGSGSGPAATVSISSNSYQAEIQAG